MEVNIVKQTKLLKQELETLIGKEVEVAINENNSIKLPKIKHYSGKVFYVSDNVFGIKTPIGKNGDTCTKSFMFSDILSNRAKVTPSEEMEG